MGDLNSLPVGTEGPNKRAASLFAVVGRAVGTLPDFGYPDALRQARWAWAPEGLHSCLSQPAKQANPGTKMKYAGLADPRDLDGLISCTGSIHK